MNTDKDTKPKRDFLDIIEEHVHTDDSVFDQALSTGYMLWYDRRAQRPAMTPAAIWAYLSDQAALSDQTSTPEWLAGLAVGYFIAMVEDDPTFYWMSAAPPTAQG